MATSENDRPPRSTRPLCAARAALLLLTALAGGCARCSSSQDPPRDAPPEAPIPKLPDLLPPPKPLTFSKLRGIPNVAVPDRCSLRSPIVKAPIAPSTRFVAEPGTLGSLIIADSEGDPPVLTGVSALTLDPEGPTRDPKPFPWTQAASLPRLAVAKGGSWIAAIERASEGPTSRVDLWTRGSVSAVGEGDRFEAADLACSERRCALLTSRLGKVAGPGAEVWIGGPDERASSWRRVEIGPSVSESDARPVKLAAVEPGVIAALEERGSCVFKLVDDPAGPRELARLPAPHGVLDVIASPLPIALTMATGVDDGGCTARPSAPEDSPPSEHDEDGEHGEHGEGGEGERRADDAANKGADAAEPAAVVGTGNTGLRVERPGQPAVEIRTAAPPLRGALRKLSKGALAVWVAPLGCQQPRRVVYAVVLDEQGALNGEVFPVADSDLFAVAASGDSVDLWIESEGSLTWVPMTCGAR